MVMSLSPSGNPGPNPSQVLRLDPSFNPWDSSSSTQLLRENDDDGDEDNDNDDDNGDDDDDNDDNEDDDNKDDLIDVDDDDNLMRLQNFDLLNDIEGMSEYELMHLQRVHRNNARLASLGLLAPMTSATTLSTDRSNRKKHAAPQDDVVRRVQPKCNAKLPTSYRDLDEHVIYKRTRPIDSSDTGEEDTVRKRMCDDKEEYRPSGGDDEEEYDDDEDKLESGEFNSHIFQKSLLSTSGSQPLNPCKRRLSSP